MSRVRPEIERLTLLALPVIGAQTGQMMLGLVDLWMVGRLGPTALAAASLGDTWCFATFILAIGLLSGMDPIVSQAHGARRNDLIARTLQHGTVLALLVTPLLAAAWWSAEPVLLWARQPRELAGPAAEYLRAQVLSIPFALLFNVLRNYLQGRGIVKPSLAVVAVANLVNFGLNQWLIFGGLGVPALGLRGAGMATGITRIFMFGALAGLVWARGWHRAAWAPWGRESFDPRGLLRLLGFGGPLALQIGLEAWAFQSATLMAGALGAAPVAAHSIVLKVASFTFMVPLGISIAASVRVGNLLGAGERAEAQRSAQVALGLGAGVMTLSAALFLLFRSSIPLLFTGDAEVAALAAALFPIAAAFQLFDGTQAVGCGVLRGMGTPLPATWINFIGYYLLGLPLGLLLSRPLGLGVRGIWWGLSLALFVVALLLVRRILRRGPATVTRLAHEA